MSEFNQSENLLIVEDSEVVTSLKEPVIKHAILRFHNSEKEFPLQIFEEPEFKFGTLEIKVRGEIPITNKHIHMLFTIDGSGSMSDRCIDGRSKMSHIKHTLENMLRLFHENNESNMSVHVQSFDTKIKTIISDVSNIREANLGELIYYVSKLAPGGSTDIGLALSSAVEHINNYKQSNPEHQIIHIFLTDGDITEGTRDYEELLSLVPKDCSNIFIGYGVDHDSKLLSHLSKEKGNDYRFIDALEKAGLVYGEVIHGILYKAIEDITISSINGEVYNFLTNSWSSELEIGDLLSEQKKTFHIRSKNTDTCLVRIIGKTIIPTQQSQNINTYENQLDVSTLPYSEADLCVYMFRQRTQELLYEARKVSDKYKKNSAFSYPNLSDDDTIDIISLNSERKNIKDKLSEFLKILRNYMKENNLESEPIMKMLCDDIYIAYKTTGTYIGTMYTCARQTSNGREQTYMCSTLEEQMPVGGIGIQRNLNKANMCVPVLQRQTNDPTVNFSSQIQVFSPDEEFADEERLDIDNYTLTQDFLSPFTSDSVLTLMREVSGNHSIGTINNHDDDEDETEELH